ncbi:MAG: hypothetical protein DRG11_04735 [Epsilonproteobacteria bacterium]|nr:MAG: hypothetical protein DRG11_04735 [Campylobacterota bacterium]
MLTIYDKSTYEKCINKKSNYDSADIKNVKIALYQYLTGQKHNIKILEAAFTNGHVNFCSQKIKMQISKYLKSLSRNKNIVKKKHLRDFINIWSYKPKAFCRSIVFS